MGLPKPKSYYTVLTDYLLVSQDQAQIEHCIRQGDGRWSYQRHAGLEAGITIQ
jgi:hypothetical protein